MRSLPAQRIEDPLGYLVEEAATMARLASTIETLRAADPNGYLDPGLHLALLRVQYFSSSIDGVTPDHLMQNIAEARDTAVAPSIRAEADGRRLVRDLAIEAAQRGWEPPLTNKELGRIDAYLACHGSSQNAVFAIKRLAEHAFARTDGRDLAVCRELVDSAMRGHPIGRAYAGSANAMLAIGTRWMPSLRLANGQNLDWSRLRGKPTVVVFASQSQTPSRAMLDALVEGRLEQHGPGFHLVIVFVKTGEVSHTGRTTNYDAAADGVVQMPRGWREPLLIEYGIRSLPSTFVLDGGGLLRRIINPADWDMIESVKSAVLDVARTHGRTTPVTLP